MSVRIPTADNPVEIVCGDALDVMRSMPGECVDLVVTSPPYNLGNTTGGGFPGVGHYSEDADMVARGGGGKWKRASAVGGLGHGYASYNDAMPHADYVMWQKDCLSEMWRLLKPTGAIYYNHKSRIFRGQLCTPLEYNPGLPVRQIVIWARAGGINFAPTHYVPTHEWIVIFAKESFRLKNKGASGVGDVWYIPQEPNPDHPAPFPVALPRRAIETTDANLILDPFSGIGSTLVAALHEGRTAIGIEKNPDYCGVSRKRVAAAMGDGGLFDAPKSIQPELFSSTD